MEMFSEPRSILVSSPTCRFGTCFPNVVTSVIFAFSRISAETTDTGMGVLITDVAPRLLAVTTISSISPELELSASWPMADAPQTITDAADNSTMQCLAIASTPRTIK